MKPKPKLEVLPDLPRLREAALEAFHEEQMRQDLESFSDAPGTLEKWFERGRIRREKNGQIAILGHYARLYEAGQKVIAARTQMERQKSEYLQLAREHEIKTQEKEASIAKYEADIAEHYLRRDMAEYKRQNLDRFVEGGRPSGTASENEQKLNDAYERRKLDARWELNESLGALNTLLELQHWRRQQRGRILKDRLLAPEEQAEALQFVDDLYQQKRAELKTDTRIFEE